MTRKEEIQMQAEKKAFEPSRLMHPYAKQHKVMSAYEIGFIEGAVWADAHPDIDVRTMAAWQSGYNEGIDKFRWISVEDELPKDGQSCIILIDRKALQGTPRIRSAVYAPNVMMQHEGFAYSHMSKKHHITHWMPLPQAPKKGGEE